MAKELSVNKNTQEIYKFYKTKLIDPKSLKEKNVLVLELGNITYIDEIKKYAKNVCVIDRAYNCIFGDVFENINTLEIQIKNFLEKNEMPKFDLAIMNPPYGGICKEIYEFLYNKKPVKELIAINPAQYWEFLPYLINDEHKEVFFSYLKNIDIISHREFCDIFSIGNAVTGNGSIVEMDYTNKNNTKEIAKLYKQFINNKLLCVLKKFINKMDKTLVAVKGVEKNKTQKTWEKNYKIYKEYGNYVKIYTWHSADNPKDMIICPDDGNGKSIIGTRTKEELDNFVNSLNTWPYYLAYYITSTDNAKMLSYCPWMDNYTNSWTNKRFVNHFGIEGYIDDNTGEKGSEWECILKIMNNLKIGK